MPIPVASLCVKYVENRERGCRGKANGDVEERGMHIRNQNTCIHRVMQVIVMPKDSEPKLGNENKHSVIAWSWNYPAVLWSTVYSKASSSRSQNEISGLVVLLSSFEYLCPSCAAFTLQRGGAVSAPPALGR